MNDETIVARFGVDLEHICLERGRCVGTPGHAEVAAFLERRMAELGLEPYTGDALRLPYQRDGIDFTNLIGVIPGADRSRAPLLIGAHYDSVIPAPCADDNAAAIAIVLEIVDRLRGSALARDIVIALFDAEEPPHFLSPSMGSIRFHEDRTDPRGFHAALILDLVGHDVRLPVPGRDALADALFVTGAESHPEFARLLAPRVERPGLRIVAVHHKYVGDMSDHHTFRRKRVPFLFLSCGRWEHYHQPTDTIDRLNLTKMVRIAAWLEDVARTVADANLEANAGNRADFTLELECSTLGGALSSLGPSALKALGVTLPRTRAELGRVAAALLSAGL